MKKRTKRTVAVAGKVLLRLVLASVLCAILYFSMLTIATGMFSEVIGYRIDEMNEDNQIVLVEKHIYAEDEKHVAKTDLNVTDDQVFTELREVPEKTLTIFQALSQVMMLIVLAIFPYHILWEFGNRDDTNVRYKGQRPDPYRGFRVGAIAAVPYAVLWVLLAFAKFGFLPEGYAQVYRLVTVPFMPFGQWVMPSGSITDATVLQLLLLLVTLVYIPIVCGVAYRLGHRQFSVREHLVFAKKEQEDEQEI